MSLVAWFPLNGNLNNYGCSDYTLTNSNATVSTDGKIGKCYSFNGTNSFLTSNFSYQNFNKNVSIAFWVKIPSFTSDNQLLWGRYQNGPFIDIQGQNIRCYLWDKNSDGTIGGAKSITFDFSSYINLWTHVTFTFDGGNANLYLNGELKKSANWNCNVFYSSSTCQIGQWNNQGRWLKGLANDFRIYNHCLRQKEVHEISKGLVVHYKLDDLNNVNLLTWSKEYSKTNPYIHTSKGTDGYLYMGNDSLITIKPSTKYTVAFNCDGNLSVHGSGVTRTYPNKDFTFWFYVRNTGTSKNIGQYDSTACFNKDNSTLNKIGDRYIFTWTSPSTAQDITIRTNTYSNGTDNISVKLWDIMIVEGEYDASIFSPGINQPQARNYVVDNSGFLNNAQIVNSLKISSNSPVYDKAIDFAQQGYIYKSDFNLKTEKFTLSYWVNPKSTTSQHFIFGTFDSWSNNGIGFYRDSGKNYWNLVLRTNGSSNYTGFGGQQVTLNTWNHFAITYDGSNIKVYVNNSLKTTQACTGYINNPVLYLGNSLYKSTPASETEDCMMSDFRLYATALTDADVEALYKVGASIDNRGNTFTNQFVEDSSIANVKINKNKQIYVKELQEENLTGTAKTKIYKTDKMIKTIQFIEN